MIDAKARFLAGEPLPSGLIPQVIERSWQRCIDRRVSVERTVGEIPMVSSGALRGFRERSGRLIHHAGPETFYDHVGLGGQPQKNFAAGRVLHIDPDRPLVAVQHQRKHAACVRAATLAAFGFARFGDGPHADDVRTQIGEVQSGHGPRQQLRMIQHPHV